MDYIQKHTISLRNRRNKAGGTSHNNRVCDAPISVFAVGVAPCACSIIKIKIDLSRHTAQTHNVSRSLQAGEKDEKKNHRVSNFGRR